MKTLIQNLRRRVTASRVFVVGLLVVFGFLLYLFSGPSAGIPPESAYIALLRHYEEVHTHLSPDTKELKQQMGKWVEGIEDGKKVYIFGKFVVTPDEYKWRVGSLDGRSGLYGTFTWNPIHGWTVSTTVKFAAFSECYGGTPSSTQSPATK